MANQEFFIQRPAVTPTIYAYELVGVQSHKGYLKVGYTDRDAETRIKEQLHTSGIPYRILLKESAMRPDGSCFTDHEVHAVLRRKGFAQYLEGADRNEWFRCSVRDVQSAILELREGITSDENRTQTFKMRPEQTVAVQKTMDYFALAKKEEPNKSPKFLWNAKMRFGKTFAAYQLARKMGFRRVLVLTFKPAVESAWREDLMTHVDFEGWQFISNKDAHNNKVNIDVQFDMADKSRPIVVFGSFQDLLGTNDNGGIKAKNEFIHATNWDLVIFDEYHFGAWRENAKKLFEDPDEEESADFDLEHYKKTEADNAYNESFLPISTDYYLFLSGTPFRAINSGEFIEDQIYNWTYSDEQRAKETWVGSGNPYLALPRMVMLTYRIPESIRQIAVQGEYDEFDLNVFFSAKGKGDEARFVYENEVQKWLDLIRGSYLPSSVDDLKLGQEKRPPMPFSDTRLLNVLSHTLWFLPNVASCHAMANLLQQRQNAFYHDYKINVCAGTGAGIGLDALRPVQVSMGNPLETKTITLSCGKLTTGVTVRPWTGIFMLRNLKSPETYFQAAFRVQSPWEVTDDNGDKRIMKQECYVFDFALDRALRQISDYSCRLDINESNPEKKVAEFINFLPVLAYDGSTMKQIDAQDILDIAMAGTSATLLAKRWESALLVNVDNDTLSRLLNNKEALDALMRIEGFRSLNQDITTIINKSESVKKAKKNGEDKLTPKEKKELTEDEKEYKSQRKQIQEKLIKFATRIPVFMYLTDFRERSLKDVITQLEPGLFKKVTGLDVSDFNLLCSIGVFNASLMNDAIFKFKRYEDSSLSYTGIEKHISDEIGGWDTVIRREEYQKLFYNQQSTMEPTKEDAREKISPEQPQTEKKEPAAPPTLVTAAFGVKPPVTTTVRKAEEPQKPALDLSGVTVGTAVFHKKFGEGKVSNIDKAKKYIRVVFAVGEKMFVFPSCFEEGFLAIK
ncbi:MAG: GIY-YIG nuclease family protein [Clostridia bacterium]|nr:GIY-YIG nuclease family protein [Clostridia bacterium]MDY6184557.1 GIY-YIG nuclease family protein [Eubacteriales bacterium]